MTIGVTINGTKHTKGQDNACVCMMHDFSAVVVDKVGRMKKNGLRPYLIRLFSLSLSLSVVLFVSIIIACFRYRLQTFLYIVSIDKNRQTNRHHGYIFYTYVIQWSIFDVHTNVLLYLHSCVLLLKQE
jgi:hypothetical protein